MLYHARKVRAFLTMKQEYKIRRAVYPFMPSKKRPVDALVHACVWKTASQWVRLILTDPRFYRQTSLLPVPFHSDWEISEYEIRQGTVTTNLYCSYQAFQSIPQPKNTASFFVVRDPRDILLSWYISNRYTHPLNHEVIPLRKAMDGMTDEEGLLFTVGMFDQVSQILKSWQDASRLSEKATIVRFEDLTGPLKEEVWAALFERLGVAIDRKTISSLLNFYDFRKMKNPNPLSGSQKYRSGKPGAWKEEMPSGVSAKFHQDFSWLIDELGYQV